MKYLSKKLILGLILYLGIGAVMGGLLVNDFAHEDAKIGAVCESYDSCFKEYVFIIPVVAVVWPLATFMVLINFTPTSLLAFVGFLPMILFIKYFPSGRTQGKTVLKQ